MFSVSDQNLAKFTLLNSGLLKNKYTIKQMKVMLAERHLQVSGNKDELIERLSDYVKAKKST